jgi:hypothetical protein
MWFDFRDRNLKTTEARRHEDSQSLMNSTRREEAFCPLLKAKEISSFVKVTIYKNTGRGSNIVKKNYQTPCPSVSVVKISRKLLSADQMDCTQDPIHLDDYFPIIWIVCTLNTSIFFLPAVTNVSIKSKEYLLSSRASTAATSAVA